MVLHYLKNPCRSQRVFQGKRFLIYYYYDTLVLQWDFYY